MRKDSLDFKLNYYYYKYKDTPLPNSDVFRKRFKKEHGKISIFKWTNNYDYEKGY